MAALALVLSRGLLLAALLRHAATRRPDPTPWSARWMAVIVGSWLVSDLLRLVPWWTSGAWPSPPGPAEILRFAGYWAFAAGLALSLLRRGEPFGTYKGALDAGILLAGGGALFWLIFIVPLEQMGFFSAASLLWLIQDPLLTSMLALLALRHGLLVSRHEAGLVHTMLWAGAFALSSASGMVWAYQLAREVPVSVFQLALLRTASCLLALGGTVAWAPPGRRLWRWIRRRREIWDVLLPLGMAYLVTGYLVANWLTERAFDSVGVAAAVVMAGLLVTREGVRLGQREMRKYEALVEGTGDLAFLMDGEGRVTFANPAFRLAAGLPSRGALNLSLADLLGSSRRAGLLLQLAHERGWAGEISLRMPGGRDLPVHLSLRPIRLGPRGGRAWSCVAHDLSERQQRENDLQRALGRLAAAQKELEELNQVLEARVAERTRRLQETVEELARLNEELKSLDRLKTDFLALVSHELRAPLTNISTGVELLLRKEGQRDPFERKSLKLIQLETMRLARLVETVLDLSALEAGRLDLRIEPVTLPEVWQAVLDRLGARPDLERVRARFSRSLPHLQADPRALCSVLFHLLDNAFKYAPEGPIKVHARRNGGGVEIVVEDAGPGIPQSERERVFEMFHRLDTRDAREVYGYGLGLPMARRLMEAMDGWIVVSASRLGGARFSLWLPQCAEQAPAGEQNIAHTAGKGRSA